MHYVGHGPHDGNELSVRSIHECREIAKALRASAIRTT